jgi:hypothetical protein
MPPTCGGTFPVSERTRILHRPGETPASRRSRSPRAAARDGRAVPRRRARGAGTRAGRDPVLREGGVGRSMFVSTRGPRYDQENRPPLFTDPAGVLRRARTRGFSGRNGCVPFHAVSFGRIVPPGRNESATPEALALNALIRSRRHSAGVAGIGAV